MRWKILWAVVVCFATIGVAAADGDMGHKEPQSVGATCGTTSADVSWAAVQDARLSGYDVYEKAFGATDFTKANAALVTGIQYTVSGLSFGTAYAFGVVAVYDDGHESAMSVLAACTTG